MSIIPVPREVLERALWLIRLRNFDPDSKTGKLAADLDALIAQPESIESRPDAPEGFVLVPREPTPEMIEAAASFGGPGNGYNAQRGREAVETWKEMLAAAPKGESNPMPDAPATILALIARNRKLEAVATAVRGSMLEFDNAHDIDGTPTYRSITDLRAAIKELDMP
ncbi:MAG: hypothetical protein H7255_08830 [Ramlibacter sp.]|nr:hypothetical protein [Ramlibacter sp.]